MPEIFTEELLEETPFFNGKLKIFQPKRGFRFGLDSILLANFVNLKLKESILEACAGTGIITFTALLKFPKVKIFLLEIEDLYLRALRLGIKENHLEERANLIKGDIMRPPFRPESLDVVFANPPYFEKGRGRESPDALKNLARRGKDFELKGFLKAVSLILKKGGRLYLIFSALRLSELFRALQDASLEPKVLRMVHSYPGAEAKLCLVKAVKGASPEIRVLPPLFIYQGKNQDYTEEVKAFFRL